MEDHYIDSCSRGRTPREAEAVDERSPHASTPILDRDSIDDGDGDDLKYGEEHDDLKYGEEHDEDLDDGYYYEREDAGHERGDLYHERKDSDHERKDSDHERQGLIARQSDHRMAWSPRPPGQSHRLSARTTEHSGTAAVLEERREATVRPRRVSWLDLPKKGQLILLTLTRLSEPLTQTSLQAYMFFQLRRFDPSLPDSAIAAQIGFLQAAFTGAQCCTSLLWGRLADSERVGRKRVILVGLLGTSLGALGFGFSPSFYAALFWRAFAGALNGNVGILRAMVSETIKEKKYQPTAFLLLPMTFNVGVIVGPVLGGLLADPVTTFPHIFGPGGSLGGPKGVAWMARWPYALPNIIMAVFLAMSAMAVIFGLEETLEGLEGRRDRGLEVSRWIRTRIFRSRRHHHDYSPLSASSGGSSDIELQHEASTPVRPRQKLPFSRIWTRNLVFTLLSNGLMACHVGAFNSLWFIFLSTARYVPPSPADSHPNASLRLPDDYLPSPPLRFTGGLGLPSPIIGTSLAILGVMGLVLQLLVYPPATYRLGTTLSFRLSTLLFPITYLAAPFLALLPTISPAPSPADGARFWAGLVAVLAVQVCGRTFALPAAQILLNNAVPHPSVLATVHGVGQTVSSAARTLGPVLGGWAYGIGLRRGYVGACWWGLAGVAVLAAVAAVAVRDGDGHEIRLEGEGVQVEIDRDGIEAKEKADSVHDVGTGSHQVGTAIVGVRAACHAEGTET